MLRIGCHLSSSKGYQAMGKEAEKIGAGTFQFFTRNPRGGSAKKIDPDDAEPVSCICLGKGNRKDTGPCALYAERLFCG